MVQQQALRDFSQAMVSFYEKAIRKPSWRKAGRREGFRVVGSRGLAWDVRRLSRHVGEVRMPKVGWIRFRWSRAVGTDAKSFRVTLDTAGRWHVAFAAVPKPTPGPGTGEVVGVDRGVAVSAALSTGEMLTVPRLSQGRQRHLLQMERKASRAQPGSRGRERARRAAARVRVRETDTRRDWCHKVSTDLARRFDVIRVEDIKVSNLVRRPKVNVRQKAGVNREIMRSGWGRLVTFLDHKAPGRVEKINPAFTSQCCSCCGHVDAKSRKSQADFVCTACGYSDNADVNAAKNIAAGHAVTARGGSQLESVNREPQIAA